jgi:hypothetical protein
MSEDFLKFLLVSSWSNDGDAIHAWNCSAPSEAITKLRALALCNRHTLRAALVSNDKEGALDFFWTRFQDFSFDRPHWFRFSTGIKAFLSMECTNETDALNAAWKEAVTIVPRIYEPLILRLTPAEKLSLRSQEGTLPKWVKAADAYVLWAINGINESTVCTSRRIIKHPANAGLYVQSTVYNTLAKLRESGLVTEQWIESLKVYVVTRQGQCALEAMENDYADNHLRRSARSLKIDS